jgi:hypothetical protein
MQGREEREENGFGPNALFLEDVFSNADISSPAAFILFLGVPTELTATLSLDDL